MRISEKINLSFNPLSATGWASIFWRELQSATRFRERLEKVKSLNYLYIYTHTTTPRCRHPNKTTKSDPQSDHLPYDEVMFVSFVIHVLMYLYRIVYLSYLVEAIHLGHLMWHAHPVLDVPRIHRICTQNTLCDLNRSLTYASHTSCEDTPSTSGGIRVRNTQTNVSFFILHYVN